MKGLYGGIYQTGLPKPILECRKGILKKKFGSVICVKHLLNRVNLLNRYFSGLDRLVQRTGGPILHPAQLIFYTDACIIANLHRAQR